MTSVTLSHCAGESDLRKHNGEKEVNVLEFPDLIHFFSSPSFTLAIQYSTPCEKFLNVWSSIFELIQSYRSGSSVIPIRGLCLLMSNKCEHIIINQSTQLLSFVGQNPIGLENHGGMQSISGSYGGDQDDKEIRGDPSGGKQDPDSVSGAEHPCSSLGCADPFLGAGVGLTHEEGRFCGGISSVRILIRRCVT